MKMKTKLLFLLKLSGEWMKSQERLKDMGELMHLIQLIHLVGKIKS